MQHWLPNESVLTLWRKEKQMLASKAVPSIRTFCSIAAVTVAMSHVTFQWLPVASSYHTGRRRYEYLYNFSLHVQTSHVPHNNIDIHWLIYKFSWSRKTHVNSITLVNKFYQQIPRPVLYNLYNVVNCCFSLSWNEKKVQRNQARPLRALE